MNRIEVLQHLLSKRSTATYLEIGVHKGKVFLNVSAKRKIAVDPNFRISIPRHWMGLVKNPSNRRSEYFEMTSDAFFQQHAEVLAEGVDVAFIDGLHTHEQVHRDVVNVLAHLKDDGVIVMHDCNPLTYTAAQYALSPAEAKSHGHPGWDGTWNGDVYKAVIQLRSERDDLRIVVLDCDHGLGIIRRGKPETMLTLTPEQISSMTYEEFAANRRTLINLRSPDDFFEDFQQAA